MHVDAEVVTGAVHHVAAVLAAGVGVERLLGRDRQQPPLGRAAGDDGHRGLVHLTEAHAGLRDGERRVGGLEHRVVHAALHVGEGPRHGERARDVGGVQAVDLDTRVDEDQVARHDGAVVPGPVQVAGVRARRGDRVVALTVALDAGALVEDALHRPLAAGRVDDPGEVRDDVVEAARGDRDGEPQLLDLVGVLHEPQLRDEARQVGVLLQHEVAGERVERIEVRRREAEVGCHAAEGRPGTDPELADRGVAVELRRRAVGPLAEVQGHVVAGLAGRFEHEHRVGHGVAPPAGEVRERGVCAERVVGVVRALLVGAGGEDEPLAGEGGGQRVAAGGGVRRLRARRGSLLGAVGPARRDRLEEPAREGLLAVEVLGGRLGLGSRRVGLVRAHASSLPLRRAAGTSECTRDGRADGQRAAGSSCATSGR